MRTWRVGWTLMAAAMLLMPVAPALAQGGHGGGGHGGGGGGCGDRFGDLIHILRDDVTGQPILAKRWIEMQGAQSPANLQPDRFSRPDYLARTDSSTVRLSVSGQPEPTARATAPRLTRTTSKDRPMAKSSPQTFAKRQREIRKQQKRAAKIEARLMKSEECLPFMFE